MPQTASIETLWVVIFVGRDESETTVARGFALRWFDGSPLKAAVP